MQGSTSCTPHGAAIYIFRKMGKFPSPAPRLSELVHSLSFCPVCTSIFMRMLMPCQGPFILIVILWPRPFMLMPCVALLLRIPFLSHPLRRRLKLLFVFFFLRARSKLSFSVAVISNWRKLSCALLQKRKTGWGWKFRRYLVPATKARVHAQTCILIASS